MATELDLVREWFADEIAYSKGIGCQRLVEAFTSVPRERFLPPGPWSIITSNSKKRHVTTKTARPTEVYHDAPFVIDARKKVHNGQPSLWASAIDRCEPHSANRVLHVGGATGYYSAILAEMVGPDGTVISVEVDPDLAEIATKNLEAWPNVTVINSDWRNLDQDLSFDYVLFTTGVPNLPDEIFERLGPSGRIVFPFVVREENSQFGEGELIALSRVDNDVWRAASISKVSIYCDQFTEPALIPSVTVFLVRKQIENSEHSLRSLRRLDQSPDNSCLLLCKNWWFSSKPTSADAIRFIPGAAGTA